jgi:hypothetical protein
MLPRVEACAGELTMDVYERALRKPRSLDGLTLSDQGSP